MQVGSNLLRIQPLLSESSFLPVLTRHIARPACTQDEVNAVFASAKVAQKTWAKTPLWKRAELLHKAAAMLKEHKTPIAAALVKEIAKPAKDAVTEVRTTKLDFELWARLPDLMLDLKNALVLKALVIKSVLSTEYTVCGKVVRQQASVAGALIPNSLWLAP